jgi:hypothetical protein
MDVYEIKFTENYKVSLVKDPAIESTLLKFKNETEDILYFANEEKKIVYSVAMIPNKLIPRNNVKGKPANVFYSAETIEKFQQNYFRTNANNGTNINHATFNTEGIFPFESWIVSNSENDKSNELGLNAPNGSLIMGFKIDNPEVWDEVKSGNLDGLSVEGNVIFEQQTNIKMTKDKESFFSHVKAYFMEHDDEEKDKEVEKMAEHDLPDPAADPAADPAVNPDAAADAPTDDHAEEMNKMKEQIALLEEKVSMMEAEKVKDETSLTTMQAEKEKAEADLAKFKNEKPAVPGIKNVPTPEVVLPYEQMSNFQKLKFNKENGVR